MGFKLILAMVQEDRVEAVLKAAREAGATGATVVPSARGEGLVPKKTFLGLNLTAEYDLMLFIVEAGLAVQVLARIGEVGEFETRAGAGLAIQLAVEEAVGLSGQLAALAGAARPPE